MRDAPPPTPPRSPVLVLRAHLARTNERGLRNHAAGARCVTPRPPWLVTLEEGSDGFLARVEAREVAQTLSKPLGEAEV